MADLKVLGPKDIGRGILIEHDGFISPDDLNNKRIISEALKNLDFSEDLILYAVLQKFGIPNKNGRIYPEPILKREMEKYQTVIKKGGAMSELNYPSSSLIDLDRVSHSILETWWDGNILMAKIKLITSPGWRKMGIISCKGDQAANIIMNGNTLGISSRGVGSLKNVRGQNIVQDDFEIVCFDLVSSPSTPGAYVFADPADRDQYQESEEKSLVEPGFDKMKSLMQNLDTFLGK